MASLGRSQWDLHEQESCAPELGATRRKGRPHNFAGHIWDIPDKRGQGAMACVVVPWFADRYEAGADWRAMAYWIHNHLPYSELQFFPKLCAFNIGWHEQPRRAVYSFIKPAIELPHGSPPSEAYAEWFAGFPDLRSGAD